MGIVKFSIWLKKLAFIVSIIVGIFSERLTDTSCQDFSLWFWFLVPIFLVLFKTDEKCLTEWSFFQNGLPFFVFDFCHIYQRSISLVLLLKIKLSIAFCEFMLQKITYVRVFSEPNMTLSYHCKHWNQFKPKATFHTQLNFPLLEY